MSTLFYSHPDCELHEMGRDHPESPARLVKVNQLVRATDWGETLQFIDAPLANFEEALSVHPEQYLDHLLELQPTEGHVFIDGDTKINSHSLSSARRAVGAALSATEAVAKGSANNAFCAIRPPGHHAESAIAMGFCLFNSVAIAAEKALSMSYKRVAILDFDVHHGNGTVEIFQDRPEVLVCSSFQYPFYPGRYDDVSRSNICLTPLRSGSASSEFRQAIESQWAPALENHQPEFIFISAGFDAHKDDPLGGLCLTDDDYFWITQWIKDQALNCAEGRIVSLLEGGYDLNALSRSVVQHLRGLS